MKKIFAILVILCICITCFVACGNRGDKDTTSSSTPNNSSKTPLTSEELESFWGGVSIEIDVGSNTSSTDNNSSTVTDTSSNTTTSTTTSSTSTSTSTTTSTTQSISSSSEEEIPSTPSNITNSRNPQDIGWGPWV